MLAFIGLSCRNGHANKALMPVKKVQSSHKKFRLVAGHWWGVTMAMLTLRVI
jgi:hypothetical protein